ncbi:MAG: hypothetical protein MMC23_007201 [Stictis urceolatum]|nr:hypothetical protein [Stictis urceolata]
MPSSSQFILFSSLLVSSLARAQAVTISTAVSFSNSTSSTIVPPSDTPPSSTTEAGGFTAISTSINGVTANTQIQTTNDQGSTTIVPVWFVNPTLELLNLPKAGPWPTGPPPPPVWPGVTPLPTLYVDPNDPSGTPSTDPPSHDPTNDPTNDPTDTNPPSTTQPLSTTEPQSTTQPPSTAQPSTTQPTTTEVACSLPNLDDPDLNPASDYPFAFGDDGPLPTITLDDDDDLVDLATSTGSVAPTSAPPITTSSPTTTSAAPSPPTTTSIPPATTSVAPPPTTTAPPAGPPSCGLSGDCPANFCPTSGVVYVLCVSSQCTCSTQGPIPTLR